MAVQVKCDEKKAGRVRPVVRTFPRPPFAKYAKDGAPPSVSYSGEIKSLGHPPDHTARRPRSLLRRSLLALITYSKRGALL
jgi:hypothetical protein